METKENTKEAVEQYKAYINSKERLADRNFATNKFFLVFNTALFLFIYNFSPSDNGYGLTLDLMLSIIGLVTSCLWMNNIGIYDTIVSVKLRKVIEKMEESLPLQPYSLESQEMGYIKEKGKKFDFMRLTFIGSQKALALSMATAFFMFILINTVDKYVEFFYRYFW